MRTGENGFGLFCRNKRASPCEAETPHKINLDSRLKLREWRIEVERELCSSHCFRYQQKRSERTHAIFRQSSSEARGHVFRSIVVLWEKEAESALGAKQAGKVKALYKVVGQRRVLAIADMKPHDELDRILMAGIPMANVLEVEEVLPIRAYEDFADDRKRRWK